MLRYAYIRSSMVRDIQFILKRDSFLVKLVIFGESLLVIMFAAMYHHLINPEVSRTEFILYKACVDPWSNFRTNIWHIFPVGQILLHSFNLAYIIFNILLYKYLDQTVKASTALRPLDKKAERKINIFPAQTHILLLWLNEKPVATKPYAWGFYISNKNHQNWIKSLWKQ